jgi:uncharacterized protein
MLYLGLHYDNGQGVAQDYAKAREWYEKAADNGDAGALTCLGVLYDNGQGVAALMDPGLRCCCAICS